MPVPESRLRQLRDLLSRTAIEGAGGVPYYVHDLLGEGGQGWVYRASYDEPDGPWVVIKLLRPDVVTEEALSRFLREADVLRKLGQSQAPCPSVIRFYDHGVFRYTMPDGETYALPFTVLEYVNGTTLAELLAKTPHQGLGASRTRRLFRQVARALGVIHTAQIVHRDLKPSNLLIASDAGQEVMKLSDFGLVKRFDIDIKGTVQLAGASIGYAPPEQFEAGNKRVSGRTDLFAFAAVLYETLTTQPAFPVLSGESPFQVLSRVLSGARPLMANTLGTLPPELAERRDLVAALDIELVKAMAPDPGDRHESVKQFWDLVDPLLRAASGQAAPSTMKFSSHVPAGEPSVAWPSNTRQPPPASRPSEGPPMTSASPATQGSNRSSPSGSRPAMSVAVPGLRPVATALLPERARTMSISSEPRSGCALARQTLHRFDGTLWSTVLPQPAMDLSRMRGALAMPGGEMLLYGEQGALIGVALDGVAKAWSPPEQEITWVSATLSPGEIVLLGEIAGQRAAVVGSLRPGQMLIKQRIDTPSRLHSACRIASGGVLVCGDGGELLHVMGPQVSSIAWGRTGHLLALAAAPSGGAYAVGSGGHAVWITAGLEAKLEPVQTTRDLFCVSVSSTGTAWAGGGDARLVRRGSNGWARIPLPATMHGAIRSLHAAGSGVLAALDDGAVVDGGAA